MEKKIEKKRAGSREPGVKKWVRDAGPQGPALRTSERQFQGTFENAAVGIAHVSPGGRLLRVNRKFCQILGYDQDELLRRNIREITPAEDLERVLAHSRRLLAGEIESYVLENRFLRPDGSMVWVNLTVALQRDENAAPEYFIGVVQDVTEHKQAEEALQKSETRYRSLFSNMMDGFAFHRVLLDASGKPVDYVFLEVNEAFEKLTGFTREEVVGRRIKEVLPDIEQHPADLIGRAGRVALTGEPSKFEMYSPRLNKWFSVSLFSPEKEYFITVFEDVTERKETALQTEERFREQAALLELAQEAIVVRDPDDRIVFWNRGAERVYGWLKEEALGAGSFALLKTEFPKALEEIRADLLSNGYWQGELLHTRRDGKRVNIESRWALQRDRDGRAAAILEINRDITERKQAQEKLRESEEELRYLSAQLLMAQEKERKRISQDLHDSIWQTLVALQHEIEHLFDRRKSAAAAEASGPQRVIGAIRETVDRIRTMQGELWPSVLDDIGIRATIDWYCREFQKRYAGIRVEKHVAVEEEEVSPPVKITIYRILREALNNVAQYSRASRVTVSFLKKEGRIHFRVEDNGIGFDPEKVLSRASRGAGLGILSMRERTELSGGSFRLESTPGGGTVIQAWWPL